MHCLKCGNETNEHQVFCDSCLAGMESCPVKPGTGVHLPHHEQPAAVKKQLHKKRPQTSEEQVVLLKKLVKRLVLALALVSIVLCLATAMLVHNLFDRQSTTVVGRNYTIDTTQGS